MAAIRSAQPEGREQDLFELLQQALLHRYAEHGVPAALHMLDSLAKWVGLFTAFAPEREAADAMAAAKIRERVDVAQRPLATWAGEHLSAEQRRYDEETLRLLLEELRELQEHHGMAKMLEADPVFSLMTVHGAAGAADAVAANKAASEKLQDYLVRVRAAREATGPEWWSR